MTLELDTFSWPIRTIESIQYHAQSDSIRCVFFDSQNRWDVSVNLTSREYSIEGHGTGSLGPIQYAKWSLFWKTYLDETKKLDSRKKVQ